MERARKAREDARKAQEDARKAEEAARKAEVQRQRRAQEAARKAEIERLVLNVCNAEVERVRALWRKPYKQCTKKEKRERARRMRQHVIRWQTYV